MNQPTACAFASLYDYNPVPLAANPFLSYHSWNLQMNQYNQLRLANLNLTLQCNQMLVHQKNMQNLLLSQQKQVQDYYRTKNTKEDTLIYPVIEAHNDQIESQKKLKVEEGNEVYFNTTTSSSHIRQNNSPQDCQRESVNDLLSYFQSHFGRVDLKELHKQKMKYAHDPVLTQLFDVLTLKYKTGSKSREDMIRFVMRKSLTWLRDQARDKSSISAKAASVSLCHKYFAVDSANKSDDELLSLLLPYKKNSRYPVVNSQFMKEIFGSKEFCQDYMRYLEMYKEIMEKENQKKIKQFTEFLLSCVQNNCLDKVLNYKRVPWLDVWVDASQTVAFEIYELHSPMNEERDQILPKTKKQVKTK